MPGAGALGLGEALEAIPGIATTLDAALEALGADFAEVDPEARHGAVEALAAEQPALVPSILFQLYQLYYAEPRVLAALGMPARPPYPEGYEMEPNELDRLERVRARERIYRDA